MPLFSQEPVLADNAIHDVKSFDCGKPDMNTFLARFAAKHMKLGVSRTWVLTVAGESFDECRGDCRAQVAAYYSLTFGTVHRNDVPFKGSLPVYPVSVVILARLAVDIQFQGEGLGGKILVTALRKSVELTDAGLPAIGVVLDVLDDRALEFYKKYEIFEQFTNNPMRLFTSASVIRQI